MLSACPPQPTNRSASLRPLGILKQRIKLAQALFTDTPIVLALDEPCTNLDADGIGLYQRLIGEHTGGRLVIVSSNDPQEYDFCDKVINITEYK